MYYTSQYISFIFCTHFWQTKCVQSAGASILMRMLLDGLTVCPHKPSSAVKHGITIGEVSRSKPALHFGALGFCKSWSISSPNLGLKTERQDKFGAQRLIMHMSLILCLEPQTDPDTSPNIRSLSQNMWFRSWEAKHKTVLLHMCFGTFAPKVAQVLASVLPKETRGKYLSDLRLLLG